MAYHDTELAGKAPHDGQSMVSGGLQRFCISIWSTAVLYKYMDKLNFMQMHKIAPAINYFYEDVV